MSILSHDEFKTKYLFGKETLFNGIAEPDIDNLLAISEEIVKIDLNLSTLPTTEIYKILVAYYTLHSVATKAVIEKDSKSAYKEEYDRLIAKMRKSPIGITIVDEEELEEE